MNLLYGALLGAMLTLALPAQAAVDVAGVRFEDQSSVQGTTLQLNGAGVRTRFFFKVYAMALYLPSPGRSAAQVLAADEARQVRIVTLRDLSAKQFADALVEGIVNNHSEQQFSALKARVDALQDTMLELREAPAGTLVVLEYLPGVGTRLHVDGSARGDAIAGADFFAGLLRVWLGERPADADLKRALLGAAH